VRVQFGGVTIRCVAFIAALGFLVAPAAAQTSAIKPVPKKVHLHYVCQGYKIPVTYDNVKDKAIVTWGNRRYGLPHVMSADGARYMNDKLEWWEKGPTATVSSVTDGKADNLLATCTEIPKK
jgi:membrane-bound inhibitor of C-type lysozyme